MTSSRRGIPFLFYFFAALATHGITIGFAGLLHSFLLFSGSHVISLTTFILAALLSISLGSLISGRLAVNSLRPMLLVIIFLAITGLLFLFQPTALQTAKGLYHQTLHVLDPGPFGIEILRFTLAFVLLFIPLALFAGSFPMLIRHFIKHVSQSGRYMNAAILSGSTGTAATLLSMQYLILPIFGYGAVHIAAFLCLSIAALMAYLFSFGKLSKTIKFSILPKYEQVIKTTLRFRKKKPVLEMGAKLTNAMLKVLYLQGFSIASMVFLTFRITSMNCCGAPSHLLVVNGIPIMAGIISGGLLYKKVAEKPVNKYMTLATLQITTGFVLVLSYILMRVISASHQTEPSWIHPGSEVSLPGMILRSASLLFFPAFFYGLSLPLAGKLYPKRLQQVATAFGRLGASFSLFAVFGTLVTIHILTPLFGIQLTYLLFAFVTLLSGIYLIFMDSRLIRLFRLSYAVAAVFLFLALSASFRLTEKSQSSPTTIRTIEGKSATFTAQSLGNGKINVLFNGKYFFGSDTSNYKAQSFSAYLPLLVYPKMQSSLVIGFGLGITASILEANGIDEVYISDKYTEAIRLSADVFGDINNDILTSSNVRIFSEDARAFLSHSKENFGLITIPINMFDLAPSLYTVEFYRLSAEKLSDKGVFCQVLPAKESALSALKSCSKVFPEVSLWYISPDYLLMMASRNQQKTDFCAFTEAFAAVNKNRSLNYIGIPDAETLLAHAVISDSRLLELVNDIPENTDNNAAYNIASKRDKTSRSPWLSDISPDCSQFFVKDGCVQDSAEFCNRIKRINRQLLQQAAPTSFRLP